MAVLVAKEVAEAEVERWLAYKRVNDTDRESSKGHIDVMVDAVKDGHLIIDDECNITHRLIFPTETEKPVLELKYKRRLMERDTEKTLKGVGIGDYDGRIKGFIQALTNETKGVIGAMDTADIKIAKAIAAFFFHI